MPASGYTRNHQDETSEARNDNMRGNFCAKGNKENKAVKKKGTKRVASFLLPPGPFFEKMAALLFRLVSQTKIEEGKESSGQSTVQWSVTKCGTQ